MVNLIECLAMAASAAAAAAGNGTHDDAAGTVTQCMSTWLIKTHTHFHGSDDLHLPWYFGALCWSYAVGGIMMFVVEPKWTRKSRFPYRLMAWALILLQCECGIMSLSVGMIRSND